MKEMDAVIVLKQTTALGPQTTVLARFNLVCSMFNVTEGGEGGISNLFEGRMEWLINSRS